MTETEFAFDDDMSATDERSNAPSTAPSTAATEGGTAYLTLSEDTIQEGFRYLQMTKNMFSGTVQGTTFLVALHEAIVCLAVSQTSPFLQLVYAPGIFSAMHSEVREVHDGSLVFISGNPANETARLLLPADSDELLGDTINAQVPPLEDFKKLEGDKLAPRMIGYDTEKLQYLLPVPAEWVKDWIEHDTLAPHDVIARLEQIQVKCSEEQKEIIEDMCKWVRAAIVQDSVEKKYSQLRWEWSAPQMNKQRKKWLNKHIQAK